MKNLTQTALEAHPSFQHLLQLARYHCGTPEEQESARHAFQRETENGKYTLEDVVSDALSDYCPMAKLEPDGRRVAWLQLDLDDKRKLQLLIVFTGYPGSVTATRTTFRRTGGNTSRQTVDRLYLVANHAHDLLTALARKIADEDLGGLDYL